MPSKFLSRIKLIECKIPSCLCWEEKVAYKLLRFNNSANFTQTLKVKMHGALLKKIRSFCYY